VVRAGKGCGHDDRAARLEHARQAADAEHDPVDVRPKDPAVLLVGHFRDVALAGDHARVQAGEVDRADAFPRPRIGDVEAVDEVEHLHLYGVALELGHDRRADS